MAAGSSGNSSSTNERLAGIESTLAGMKESLDKFDRKLFGNGQPGEVSVLHGRISGVDKRVVRLEKWKVWLVGVGAGFGTAGGVIGYFLGLAS